MASTQQQAEATCLDNADDEQVRMMAEEVILLNEQDEVIGHASKKDSHLNSNINAGMLHRAFSVFLINSSGELLMQQRSSDKITFPAFWANSCCSHPLHVESELIAEDQLGVKNAARRKMEQELGIDPEQVPLSSFTYLTRVHYKAVSDGVWGEHEIDYILFCRPPNDVKLNLNPNEVQDARWFSRAALDDFVDCADKRGDLVSPWFRVIKSLLMPQWWDALEGNKLESMVDLNTIHRAGDSPNTNQGDHYKKVTAEE